MHIQLTAEVLKVWGEAPLIGNKDMTGEVQRTDGKFAFFVPILIYAFVYWQ